MKSALVSVVVGLPLLSLASASGTVQLGLKREVGASPALRKRASGVVSAGLSESTTLVQYFVDVSIGTPAQSLQLILDTGSSDVWAVSSNAFVDPANPSATTSGGTFNSDNSKTFDDIIPGGFGVQYADLSYNLGDYFTDTLTIGDVSVTDFQMGLATNTTNPIGILGVGFKGAEGNGQVKEYPNLVDTMVAQDKIATQAYSVWLNDLDSGKGQILFGGIDTGKYSGTLASLVIYPSQITGIVDAMSVSFTSLSITTNSGTTQITPSSFEAQAAILDTGSTNTVLPDALAQTIFDIAGAQYVAEAGSAFLPCAARNVEGKISFGFGGSNGPVIDVPISEMIYEVISNGSTVPAQEFFPRASESDTVCSLHVTPLSVLGEGSPILFGDSFCRSAYIVYDLANERIALAQTDFNSTKSNIVAFESLSAPIPSATTVSNEESVSYTVTGTAVFNVPVPTFSQITTEYFVGSAGGAFATAVAAAESLTAPAGIQTTANPGSGSQSTSTSKAGAMAMATGRPGFAAGVLAVGVAVLM